MLRISASALKMLPSYDGCMRKIWYREHGKFIRTNATDTSASELGTVVHAVLAKYLSVHDKTKFRMDDETIYALDKHKNNGGMIMAFDQVDRIKRLVDTGIKQIEGFENFYLLFQPEFQVMYPYLKEKKMYNINGILDLVFMTKDQETGERVICVGDFKTGKIDKETDDLTPQFILYAYLFNQLYKDVSFFPLMTKGYVFGLQDNVVRILNLDNSEERALKVVDEYISKIQSKDQEEYPRNRSGLCNSWCNYSRDCIGMVLGKKV